MTPEQHLHAVESSANILKNLRQGSPPKVAVMLGSGLGGLADKIEKAVSVPYSELPGFPQLSVAGHDGLVVSGTLNGTDVIALKGRKHFYEGTDAWPLKTMIRSLQRAGIEKLFLSNAAGSLRAHIGVSELMLITDHINYLGFNPLVGPNDEAFGSRFFSMTEAWNPDFSDTVRRAAMQLNITLHEGVYVAFSGPSFETPAEIRMAQTMGADAVGMSTVPECLIARHCGMQVAGVSCITNMGAGLSDEVLSHDHTIANAAMGAAAFEMLVTEMAGLL